MDELGGGHTELALIPVPAADQHPVGVYLGGLHTGSRRTMEQSLHVVAEILSGGRCDARALDWPAVRFQHVAAVRQALCERYRPATANKILCALRGVLKAAWRLGQLSAEDYRRAADVRGVRADVLPAGRALAAGELRALFDSCLADDRPVGARDAAALALLFGCGLRRSEAVSLELSDYDLETGAVTIRQGKGRKDRTDYANTSSKLALRFWLDRRGSDPGPLLCPIRKSGRIVLRQMTDQALFYLLQRRAKKAGTRPFSPHDLRRTYITDLLEAGVDIALLSKKVGHCQVATTARYDRRGEASKRRAAELLHVPFNPEGR